ncbi:sensor histidine kinase [Nocardioides caeni]|uniref:sensor histidine kinase n=1 Tax=Nocardioides caeni TaxID=574700 RepID=UPI0019310858|nr:sensor histidine kinase [Nocardioides caeni]
MPATASTAPGPAGPFRVTGYAVAQVLLFPLAIVLFVLTVVSAVLVVAWIGIPLLLVLLPVLRWIADLHRRMAARTLGSPVPAPYAPLPEGALAALRVRATDTATWRDLLWLLWAMTGGFVLAVVVVVVFLAVVTFPVWFFGSPPVMRIRAAVDRAILTVGRTDRLEERVHALAESRADVVDHSAAELRRIERDLHDGPQARLAAAALSLGLAEDLFETDPVTARRLIGEARATTSTALVELRDVVRGIHPPVLADRGLNGAVRALAIDMAMPVEVESAVPRLPAPVESAVYFVVAECLANVGKHAAADSVHLSLHHDGRVLAGSVADDGRGGADPRRGSGLQGIATRLAAFDGTMAVSSPPGGPTVVRWEVPCPPLASSSPRTMPSSAPA